MLNATELVGFGVGGDAKHKFWRIYITKYGYQPPSDGGAIARISEIRMSEVEGDPATTDITSGGTPFGGGVACDVGAGAGFWSSTGPENAFNSVEFSGVTWNAYAYTDDPTYMFQVQCPIFIGYEFATPVDIAQFTWYHAGNTYGANSGFIDYQLQWADSIDGPWTTVFTRTGHPAIGCCYDSMHTSVVRTGVTTTTIVNP